MKQKGKDVSLWGYPAQPLPTHTRGLWGLQRPTNFRGLPESYRAYLPLPEAYHDSILLITQGVGGVGCDYSDRRSSQG